MISEYFIQKVHHDLSGQGPVFGHVAGFPFFHIINHTVYEHPPKQAAAQVSKLPCWDINLESNAL